METMYSRTLLWGKALGSKITIKLMLGITGGGQSLLLMFLREFELGLLISGSLLG